MTKQTLPRAEHFAQIGCLAVLAIMPFHALLSIALGHFVGHQALWQSWKEMLILFLSGAVVVIPILRKRLVDVVRQPLVQAIIAYAILMVSISLLLHKPDASFWFGAKIDLEFLVFFILTLIIGRSENEKKIQAIIVYTSVAVAILGIFQATIIPTTFFSWLGYNQQTIVPTQYIFGHGSPLRVFSSIGGPNQLGAFLLLPLSICLWRLKKNFRLQEVMVTILLLWAFVLTFSRSAWLGLVISVLIVLSIEANRRQLLIGAISLIICVPLLLLGLRAIMGKLAFEALVLHGSRDSNTLVGSDVNRLTSLRQGLSLATTKPWGSGLGSAGPAVFHSSRGIITENYYLQIMIEGGFIGLLLFCLVQLRLGFELFINRDKHLLAVPLLATLCGIAVVNLFLHGWADSSTALVYWGTAGLILGPHYV